MRFASIIVLAAILFPVVSSSARLSPTIGFIRSIDEVLSDSPDVLQVSVNKIVSGGCDKKFDEYSSGKYSVDEYNVKVTEVFKGELNVSDSYQFCGFSGLQTGRVYVVGLWRDEVSGVDILYPDAIFIRRMPDEFYRKTSYETATGDFDGTQFMIEAIRVPRFDRDLMNLSGQKP